VCVCVISEPVDDQIESSNELHGVQHPLVFFMDCSIMSNFDDQRGKMNIRLQGRILFN